MGSDDDDVAVNAARPLLDYHEDEGTQTLAIVTTAFGIESRHTVTITPSMPIPDAMDMVITWAEGVRDRTLSDVPDYRGERSADD